jgi:hypothetical protein
VRHLSVKRYRIYVCYMIITLYITFGIIRGYVLERITRDTGALLYIYTVEPLLSGLMTGCRWQDNQKSRIIEDDPKTTC